MGYMYFPFSKTTAVKISNIFQTTPIEDIQNAQDVDPTQIEGTDFAELWEPIWEEYPAKEVLDLE